MNDGCVVQVQLPKQKFSMSLEYDFLLGLTKNDRNVGDYSAQRRSTVRTSHKNHTSPIIRVVS